MNTPRNGSLTKMLNALQDTQSSSKDSKQIYESVLHRHFQIIQTFLQKINSLYIKNEQLESSIYAINEKIEKIETNTQNIHYQFRTTHLMIDKRLNNIMTDYANLTDQFRLIRNDLPADSYLATQNFQSKSAYLKLRAKKGINRGQISHTFKTFNNFNFSKEKLDDDIQKDSKGALGKQINNCMQNNSLKPKKQCRFDLTKKSKTCRKLAEIDRPSLITLNVHCDQSNKSEETEKFSVSVGNKQEEGQGICDDHDQEGSIEWVQGEVNRQLETFNEKFQQKIQNLNEENVKNQNEVYSKIVQQQKAILEDQLTSKIQEVKTYCQQQIDKLRNQLLQMNQKNQQVVKSLQSKMNQKIDGQFFQQSLMNLSSAFQSQLSKNVRQFSNKLQTQRAFHFLQNKINKILEDNLNQKHKRQLLMHDDPYLKINKLQSHQKIDFGASEKSIPIEQMDYLQQNGIYRSLDFSQVQFGTLDQKQHKGDSVHFKRAISNSSHKNTEFKQLKSMLLMQQSKRQKQIKMIKKYSQNEKDRFSEMNPANQHQKIGLNQWKQKVVRILNKEGVKKRKITFR